MLKRLFKQKTLSKQQLLFRYTDSIANVCIFKLEIGDNQTVFKIIEALFAVFRKFLKLKKTNPKKFDALLLDEDFYDKYISKIEKPPVKEVEDDSNIRDIEELKLEASWQLNYRCEETLIGLTLFINSFEKIWKKAYHDKRHKISVKISLELANLLSELSIDKDNELLIGQFLIFFNSLNNYGVKYYNIEIEPSLYTTAINWYIDIIFQDSIVSNKSFNIRYLNLFDQYFIYSIKMMINLKSSELYESLIGYLTTGEIMSIVV